MPKICTPDNAIWQCLSLEGTFTLANIFSTCGKIKESFSFSLDGIILEHFFLLGLLTAQSQYSMLLFGFLVGAILPILGWYLQRFFPHAKWLSLINFPIFFMAANLFPPAAASEYSTWFLVGFIFNYVLYRYAHNWWEKYAYIFSIAMSCGVTICGIVIFFALQLPKVYFPEWWGTGGPSGDGCPLAKANYSGFIASNRYL